MEQLVAAIAQHGYSILFCVVLMEAIGLPVPAALGLIVAGATIRSGEVLLVAIAAMMLGDIMMFLLGRRTGWWLLGILCRVSLNPEACILRSADTFFKRGRILLVFAKFVPGINTMAPPLAGSMNMPIWQFLTLDLVGASFYAGAYFGAGFLFSDLLAPIMRGYSTVGSVVTWAAGILFAVWIANRGRLWIQGRHETPVPALSPHEVVKRMPNVAIFDVRSHGYYDAGTQRIEGSHRMEPNALTSELAKLPRDKEIVLYCTCYREATAVRVAKLLAEKGIPSVVIEGGLGAWKKAGFPLESVPEGDVVLLPKFA